MRVFVIGVNKVIYKSLADEVVLPAYEGQMCVLNYHQSFLCRLNRGIIEIDGIFSLPINDGVARLINNDLVLMIE